MSATDSIKKEYLIPNHLSYCPFPYSDTKTQTEISFFNSEHFSEIMMANLISGHHYLHNIPLPAEVNRTTSAMMKENSLSHKHICIPIGGPSCIISHCTVIFPILKVYQNKNPFLFI